MMDLQSLSAHAPLKFIAGWESHLPSGYCPTHAHSCFEIVYHPSGAGSTSIGDGPRIQFAAGSAFVYWPGARHDQRIDTPGVEVCIQVEAAPEFLTPGHYASVPCVNSECVEAELRSLGHVHPSLAGTDRLAVDYRATSALLSLIALSAAHAPALDPVQAMVERACRYMADNLEGIRLVQEVAEHVQLSPDHFRHQFTRTKGMSPVKWLTQLRIDRARELLLRSDLRLEVVAELCGFDNERYFTMVFKRLTGVPPGSFRRSHR